MAANPKPEYNHWFKVWQEVSRSTGMTLKAFCGREGLDPECARKAFERRRKAQGKAGTRPRKDAGAKWESMRLEFLQGDWQTLRDYARHKGLNPATGYFARQTAGWLDEKAQIREQSRAESVAHLADQKGAEAIASLHGRALIALYQVLGDVEANGPVRNKIHQSIDGPRDNADFLRGVNLALDALLKVLPPIARIEAATATRTILQKVLDQGLDVTDASIRLEMMGVSLPDTLKIMLSKHIIEEPEPPANEIPSDEELERRWREGIHKIKRQEENFVPERQKELEELKEKCRDFDSFADNTVKE
jgi:hypothetical protein